MNRDAHVAASERYDTAKFTDHEIKDELGNIPPRHRSEAYLAALRAERDRRHAAQTWLVKVFSFHANDIARDDGVRLPDGWEPLRIEATSGNRFRVYARRQEVAA